MAVRILALNQRLRDDGRIHGAPRDIESQKQLTERLQQEIEPPMFDQSWAEGRAMTIDEAVTQALEGLAPITNSP